MLEVSLRVIFGLICSDAKHSLVLVSAGPIYLGLITAVKMFVETFMSTFALA